MKIENKRYLVEFCKEGGEITKFLDKKSNIQYMYQGDSSYWSGKNPTLFPIAGNTYDGTYQAKGKTYTFKNHGLIRYATLDCVAQSDDSITFSLKANEETLKSYPYLFHYQITYTLQDNKLT
ncbi:MAG: aldose 1-epimerase family protein, partial [Erysipelotrichia bacterium]|nr:aldose 1-epimerase family protein [Erysipelotrichia bacterium]